VERLRPRGGGTARRAAELRPAERQIRADLLGGRLRARPRHLARVGERGSGVVLHLGAAQQRGDVSLPTLGARVRDVQPAGLFEHVPRGERPGADGRHRERQGHSRPARLGGRRRDLADGRQHRNERAADAHLAGRGRPPRRAARPHQSADRSGLEADDRPARVTRHGDLPRHRDRHDEHAGADRRRPGPAARRRQGRLQAAEKDPDLLDREFIEQFTNGIDEYRTLFEATPWAELVRDAAISSTPASTRTTTATAASRDCAPSSS
jgi:hypothetical protein